MTATGPLEDPRRSRQRVIATYLRVALVLVLVLGLAAIAVPEARQERFGEAMVAVLILAPIGRVVWLLTRWTRRGDRRYAAAAVALLVVMGIALLVS